MSDWIVFWAMKAVGEILGGLLILLVIGAVYVGCLWWMERKR